MQTANNIHIVAPLKEHTHTIILLHGRGSQASEFASDFFESQASDDRTLPELYPTVKWVFPASATRLSTRFQEEIPEWFDIWSVEEPQERKEMQVEGLRQSIVAILAIIRSEAHLLPMEQIILGGISQGCATAIYALLFGGIRLGAFIGFCSWLPFQDNIRQTARHSSLAHGLLQETWGLFQGLESKRLTDLAPDAPSVLKTPVFLAHSEDDEVVPVRNGEELCRSLEDLGFAVTWKTYPDGGHWIHEPQGVDDLVEFLRVNALMSNPL